MTSGISITITAENHREYAEQIFNNLSQQNFNVLVNTKKNGDADVVVTKFCNRSILGSVIINGLQMRVPLTPGGQIAWDLNVESVVIFFEKNGDICIQRFFEKRQRYKLIKLSTNPI